MSLLENTRRAFSSHEDFDNEEYDNEYMEEKKENPIKKFFSDLFGFEKEDEYMDIYDERESRSEYKETPKSSRTAARFTRSGESYSSSASSSSSYSESRIGASVEVITMYPQGVDDASKIIKEVKLNKIVIFDVNDQIESSEEARRIVDFVGGAAEGLECPFSRLCASIFCIAPKGVKFTNTKTRYTK